MWDLAANGASLTHGVLSANFTPAAPSQGVHDLILSGRAIAGKILSIRSASQRADPPLVEHYVRGNDLVLPAGLAEISDRRGAGD